MSKKATVPICPKCGSKAMRQTTRYGDRYACCDLWAWGKHPLADRVLDQVVTTLLTSLGYGEGMAIFLEAVSGAHSGRPDPLELAVKGMPDRIRQQMDATRHYLVQNNIDPHFADILLSHYGDFARELDEALTALRSLPQGEVSGWRPIETAPKRGVAFLAAIMHGGQYSVVEAERIGNGVHATREGSCVGWRPDSPHKAYWMPKPAGPDAAPAQPPPSNPYEERIAQLEAALKHARDQFAFYEQQHMAKSPPDLAKAETNGKMSAMLDSALGGERT